MSDTASDSTAATKPAPVTTTTEPGIASHAALTIHDPSYAAGVRDALAIVDTHVGRLADGKELDLTAARKMRGDVEALLLPAVEAV